MALHFYVILDKLQRIFAKFLARTKENWLDFWNDLATDTLAVSKK